MKELEDLDLDIVLSYDNEQLDVDVDVGVSFDELSEITQDQVSKAIDEAYLKKAVKDLQNDYLVEDFKDDSKIEFWNTRFELLTKLGNDFYDYLKPRIGKE